MRLSIASIQSGVEHDETRQITVAKFPEDFGPAAPRLAAYRHPFIVGLDCSIAPGIPLAVIFLMAFCAFAPCVIGYLVIIPHRDQWQARQHCP